MTLLNRGNSSAVTLRKPLPVNDVTFASTIISQVDPLVAAVGAAGTKGTLMALFAPIAAAYGDLPGNFNDKSLVITSTALTTEVPFELVAARAAANQNLSTVGEGSPDYSSYLANGEFYVIYETGRIFYSKADASTAVSAAYKYRGGVSGSSVSTAITSVIPGTGATNLGKAEDSAHTSGDTGVQMLAVRQDAGGSTAGTTGDYAAVIQDANGNEFVTEGTTSYGEDYVFNVIKVQSQGTYTVPLTASALVKTGAGQLFGFVVNSCAAGATLKIWDNTSAATTVLLDTMTFTTAVVEGPKVVMLPAAVKFNTGCYFTIAVAAMSITPIWN